MVGGSGPELAGRITTVGGLYILYSQLYSCTTSFQLKIIKCLMRVQYRGEELTVSRYES